MIAALFVQYRGVYYDLPGVEPWGLPDRDARNYAGPHPVVGHPPCARWCRLAGLVEARYGYKRGDDGGCFAAALRAVRTYGGVLEHPAYSDAWKAFDLARPPRHGGWVPADRVGGWTCHVEQSRYGHRAKKATWLYCNRTQLLSLRWGSNPDQAEGVVSWCGNHIRSGRPRLRTKEASATPIAFRDRLLEIARSAQA